MLIIPIRTPVLKSGDSLANILSASVKLEDNDILVVSSKAMATTEGAAIELHNIEPTREAVQLAKICHQDPRFTEAILHETRRMNGSVLGTCPWALLTELKPAGMKTGRILCPNAGLDHSNIADGYVIGWPENPVESVVALRKSLRKKANVSIILSDSCCKPARMGVTAFALVASGIHPLQSEVGKTDLFGRELKFTHEAVADQLAVAANAVMGNANQATPAAIIRAHPFKLSEYKGWVEGIEAKEDIFKEILR